MTATIMEIIAIMFLIMAECLRQNRFGISVFESFRYSILFTPAAMALIYIFAENKGAISKIVTCKPIVYLGNISGYAFLIHQIVIRYLSILYTKLNGEELNKWIMLFVSLFITILCSEIYMKFERCYIGKTK
jgi:peptidoglycan/LPS O-acetylase OafA/YrhL